MYFFQTGTLNTGSEIYVSRSFSLMSGMGVNLWFGLLKMMLVMRASVLLWLLLLPKWCLLFVFGKEKMALGEAIRDFHPSASVLGNAKSFSHTQESWPGDTSRAALGRFFFWVLRVPSPLPFPCPLVCCPLRQQKCSTVAVTFAIWSLTLKFSLV